MANVRATAGLDFTFFENGQALVTLTPVDKDGNATSMPAGAGIPKWTVSNPAVTASPSADGLSCLLSDTNTPVTAATATATDSVSGLTGTTDPFDVVAQPPGAAVAFKLTLSAPAGAPAAAPASARKA